MKGTTKELIPKMLNLPHDKIYELKEHKEKRSLDANGYYWSLVSQIVDKLREQGLVIGKEEQHFKYLKEYGQILLVPLTPMQKPSGYFKYYESYKTGKINGQEVIQYKVYKPSSEMDSKEFWLLIKGVEQDARALNIETLEEKRLRELVERIDKER